MLIDDHINLQGGSPLAFHGVDKLGERFVDMSEPYDSNMNEIFEEAAKKNGVKLHKGDYASVLGPQLETRAENRYLKLIGADAVGMSTVPEVIVANHLGIPVSAISVITDQGDPENLKKVDIQHILENAAKAEPDLVKLFKELLQKI